MFSKIPLKRAYYNKLVVPNILSNKSQIPTIQCRVLSIWALPKLLLATHRNSRRFIWMAAGGLTLLSTTAGPIALVTIGSLASFISWRIFKNTTQWLDFTNSVILPQAAYNDIHLDTIRILKTFKNTEKGKQMLGKLKKLKNVVWGKVNKSNLTYLLDGSQQVTISFFIYEANQTKGYICHVKTLAHIIDGKVKIVRIILRSARGHKNEVLSIA